MARSVSVMSFVMWTATVGICTTGTIAGGPLKGTTSFTALALIPGPAPSTMAYTGTLTIATDQGTLNISDVGVLDWAGPFCTQVVSNGEIKHCVDGPLMGTLKKTTGGKPTASEQPLISTSTPLVADNSAVQSKSRAKQQSTLQNMWIV